MKLELNKKYVNMGGDDIITIVAINPVYKSFIGVDKDGGILSYNQNGFLVNSKASKSYDIVKEHKEPRTKDVWVVWSTRWYKLCTCRTDKDLEEYKKGFASDVEKIIATKKITLTEGQYDE